jgi:hypothetical protein
MGERRCILSDPEQKIVKSEELEQYTDERR